MFNTGDWCRGRAEHSITFAPKDFEWMRNALNEYMAEVLLLSDHQIIAFTLGFLMQRKEAIVEIASRYDIPKGEWHVRARHVSLKAGVYGTGPYTRMERIVQSIITGQPGHQCIEPGHTELTVYLFPWKEIQHEFRVFVFDGIPKGISSPITTPDVDAICKCALEFACFYQTYAADVALLSDGTYYAIEPNSIDENTGLGKELDHHQGTIIVKKKSC